MYIPKHFDEQDQAVIDALIEANPLATLITHGSSGVNSSLSSHLNANHIPLHVIRRLNEHGVITRFLEGHVAKANAIVQELRENNSLLAIFVGVQRYISPSLYASKKVDGKVVPTWNYEAVHIYGSVRLIEDEVGLMGILKSLTLSQEHSLAHPWAVDDAPADYTQKLMGAIVGFEISIERVLAKRKLSQNQPVHNQASIIAGLSTSAQLAGSLQTTSGAIDNQMVQAVAGASASANAIAIARAAAGVEKP